MTIFDEDFLLQIDNSYANGSDNLETVVGNTVAHLGFTTVRKEQFKRLLPARYTTSDFSEAFPKGKYLIVQPFGTQRSPDFLLLVDGKVLEVESKATDKSTKPMWNDGIPVEDRVYIYGSRFKCGPAEEVCTAFLGNHISKKEIKRAREARIAVKEVARMYSDALTTARPQFQFSFTPFDDKYLTREQEALKHMSQTLGV